MSKTNYAGLDYSGPGSDVNRDKDTRIRYGIMSTHAVAPEALEDIYTHGTDVDYENYIAELKDKLRGVLSDYFSDVKLSGDDISALDAAVDGAFEAVNDDLDYQNNNGCTRMLYKADGYVLQTDSYGDLWVIKSPYFTYAQFASPCAPGACHLENPLEGYGMTEEKKSEKLAANKCYCLSGDWFDKENPCPYDIYSVETGELAYDETTENVQ